MNRWIHKPRLLPATIAMLAAVLAAKSTSLVRAIVTLGQPAAFVTAAWAGTPEAAEKPGDRKSTRLNSSHPSKSRMPSSA